jgi:hypothetical protein
VKGSSNKAQDACRAETGSIGKEFPDPPTLRRGTGPPVAGVDRDPPPPRGDLEAPLGSVDNDAAEPPVSATLDKIALKKTLRRIAQTLQRCGWPQVGAWRRRPLELESIRQW